MIEDRRRLQSQLGYQFNNESLLERALSHRSRGKNNNERLEFLGDAALDFIIGEALFHKLSEVDEGDLSRQRASLVKGATLAKLARELKLGDYLLLGTGELKSGGHRRDSILADALEAIIGAIYLDSDMETCKRCVLSWFATRLESVSSDADHRDAKTRLQEFLQARGRPLPEYTVVSVEGEQHCQLFTVNCQAEGIKQAVQAQASSRKEAEKSAAAQALKILQGEVNG